MVDIDTGEIIATRYNNYSCNFCDSKDVGFSKILAWAQSCVRGIRQGKADNIELRIGFCKEKAPEYLNLEIDGIKLF